MIDCINDIANEISFRYKVSNMNKVFQFNIKQPIWHFANKNHAIMCTCNPRDDLVDRSVANQLPRYYKQTVNNIIFFDTPSNRNGRRK